MEKPDPTIKIIPIDDSTKRKLRGGDNLDNAPQPAMTTPNTTAFSTSSPSGVGVSGGPYLDGANSTRLSNMDTRLGEIEAWAVRLGFIRSR